MTASTDDLGFKDINPEMLKSLVAKASQESLEPLSPDKGLEMYENLREDELTRSTLKSHRSRLQFFLNWCEQNGIQNLNELTGRDLQAYRSWRKDGLSISSLESNMRTLRTFLRKCVKFDAVPASLPGKVEVPSVRSEDNSRNEYVPKDQAEEILRHLDKYEYGTTEHVVWVLLTAAGLRVGAIRALDVQDFKSSPEDGLIKLTHRPEAETRLKNKSESERIVHLSDYVSQVIEDYIEDQRPDVTDEYGRNPLIASEHGRLVRTTIRKYVYKWTRPCVVGGSCPHGNTENEIPQCEAMQTASSAYKCPSSSSPHTVRRGYITHELDTGVPKAVVSDRCDVSPEVIDEHYDERSEEEKMELRKDIRESVYLNEEQPGYGQ